jgi:hypothetical protein
VGWPTGVLGALIVATTSAHVNFDGWVLIFDGCVACVTVAYACSLLTVTRATGLVTIASALSIWVMSSNSSNSSDISESDDLYVSTLAAVEGALSLPFLVVVLGNFITCYGRLLVDGLFTSISTSSPDGGIIMFAAKSIIFGAEVVGVADGFGVGVANVTLPVRCCLRGG